MSVPSHNKCSMPGCSRENECMFTFPASEEERKEDLSILPNEKRTDVLRKGLSKATVPACRLPDNIMQLLKQCTMEKPIRNPLYNAVATLRNAAHQCKQRRLGVEDRTKKLERLVQTGVCQVLEDLPAPLHALISSQLCNEGRPASGRRFTEEEKIAALNIHKRIPKVYRYLSKLFLLPSVETIRKMMRRVPLRAGVCDNAFEELEQRRESFADERDKYAILIFDEFKLSPSLVYNPSMDLVEGLVDTGFSRNLDIADHAMVWMLKGVRGARPWKQPVAYTFSRGTSAAEDTVRMFKDLVRRAFQAGIVVLATVCDQGSANREVIRTLLEHSKGNAFQQSRTSPDDIIVIDDNIIVPLFDPSDLLKRVRNNLLTKDLEFSLSDNVPRVAKWSHVEDLYFIDNSNVLDRDRILRKLTEKHVYSNKIHKTKLKYCAQVFSTSVGSVMSLISRSQSKSVCGTREMPFEGVDTARFIHFMNDIFDSVNNSESISEVAEDGDGGTPDIWDVGILVFRGMRFVKRKPTDKERPEVLRNWIATLRNLKFLKERLNDLGISEFIGRNFTQDALENFFHQIRRHGYRNVYPTCSGFRGSYRSLLLNSYSQFASADINYKSNESAGFLSSLNKYLSAAPRVPMNTNFSTSLNYNVSAAPSSFIDAAMQHIVRRVNKKQVSCKFCLAVMYATDGDATTHSSVHVQASCRSLVESIVSICLANVPNIAHIDNVVATIESSLLGYINYDSCAEHGDVLATYIIRECIVYVVKNYLRKVNRVISGSETPMDTDPLLARALRI